MNSLFEETQNLHLVIAPPQVSPAIDDCYNNFLKYHLDIQELISMLLFIEWFSDPEDRDMLRMTYQTSILERYRKVDAAHFKSDAEFAQHYLSVGGTLPFDLTSFMNGHQSEFDRSWVRRARVNYQRNILFISENINNLYNDILSFYRKHPRVSNLLDEAARKYVGFFPLTQIGKLNGVEFGLSNIPSI